MNSRQDGLIGDAINALLLPPHVLDILPLEKGESEYVGAQRAGRGAAGDCSEYHLGCPTSFFQVSESLILPRWLLEGYYVYERSE